MVVVSFDWGERKTLEAMYPSATSVQKNVCDEAEAEELAFIAGTVYYRVEIGDVVQYQVGL